jgi:hypothetical protein
MVNTQAYRNRNAVYGIMALFFSWSYVDVMFSNFHLMHQANRFSSPETENVNDYMHPLEEVIQKIPTPIFFMVVNKGFENLAANFLCNTIQFENMHEHVLIATTHATSIDFLKTFTVTASFIHVNLGDMDEKSDYYTFQYKEIMFLRGQVLFEVLKVAFNQNKILSWLEPDMHYTKNLLTEPEFSMQSTQQVAFMQDFRGVCGCFIIFPPIPASVMLYQEVMHCLNPPTTRFFSENDQEILNDIIKDQTLSLNISIKILDPCKYRSGMYVEIGYPDDKYTYCPPSIQPVLQHFNWIKGESEKIKKAKRNGGWYLSDDGRTCTIYSH